MDLKKLVFSSALILSLTIIYAQGHGDKSALEGRWDITIDMEDGRPAWLEVTHSGIKTLVGRVMLVGGSARPISEVKFQNGQFSFEIPPQWERGDKNLSFQGSIKDERIEGKVTYPNNKSFSFTGVKAPGLEREEEPEWGEPIQLFNGKDLKGWHTDGRNQWVVEKGVLKSPKAGSNIMTDEVFTDFKLHIEFKYPEDGNSGVYLRGRYEVQISDGKGKEPQVDQFSAVYGLLIPNQMVAKEAGEWQAYDITLVGRRVTVVANGVPVIIDQVIPGITGGAIDSREGEPGPILLQGDHLPIEYRNIVLTPAK